MDCRSLAAAFGVGEAMLRRLEHGRFLAVVGASGSGKSSLVRAGLGELSAEITAQLQIRIDGMTAARLGDALARLTALRTDENAIADSARCARILLDSIRQEEDPATLGALEQALGDLGRRLPVETLVALAGEILAEMDAVENNVGPFPKLAHRAVNWSRPER